MNDPEPRSKNASTLARMKFENPIEKAQREQNERKYRFSSIDEALGVLVRHARTLKGGGTMDKTANYNLPQWVGTDPIRMKPFNDAFDGIDKALKANADAAQALQSGKADAQTVSALAKNLGAAGHNCRVAFGSYVGDGNVGQAAPTTLASPFYPVLVLVQRVISGNNSIANPSVFVRPNDKGTNAADKSTMDSLLYLTWADDSVSWYSYNTGGAYAQLNTYGTTYLYIILGYDKATEDAE